MKLKFIPMIGIFSVLVSSSAVAQQQQKHPEAEKALARIVLQDDFGQLKFRSREGVTMAKNDRTPGLNGLMFMRWQGDAPGAEVMASVQWFEKKEDLLKFYATTTKREDFKLAKFNGTTVWKLGENGYSWTDGEHFLVSLGGAPPPPQAMVKAWLVMIDSKVAEVEKKGDKSQAPAKPPTE